MKASEQKKDTGAWVMLVWIAFLASIVASGVGIYQLKIDDWIRGYLVMGMLFTLGSTFNLVKLMRDNRFRRIDTNAWTFQVWIAFILALGMTVIGMWNIVIPIEQGGGWAKGFMALALFFMMIMAFALSKTVRDNQPTFIDELDIDGDGHVSREEAAANTKLAKNFDALDGNRDGKLSPAEIKAHMAGNAPK